jgi:hypothetical protein
VQGRERDRVSREFQCPLDVDDQFIVTVFCGARSPWQTWEAGR